MLPASVIDPDSTECYLSDMDETGGSTRTFKTAWFSKAARKVRIGDDQICEAILAVMKGQADHLGGGVFKKRLKNNMYRSIILAKGGRYWIFEYLFAKRDRANIDEHELNDFRTLAKTYGALTRKQIARLISDEDLVEICLDDEE